MQLLSSVLDKLLDVEFGANDLSVVGSDDLTGRSEVVSFLVTRVFDSAVVVDFVVNAVAVVELFVSIIVGLGSEGKFLLLSS